MFSENNTLSKRQIQRMLIFDIFSISLITVPGIAVMGAGRDGVFSILLGFAAALGYTAFFLYVSKKSEGDYISYAKKVFGKNLMILIEILYLMKILFSCWFTLSLFCRVLNKTLLPNTDYRIIIATLILMGIYMAAKGIKVRARVSEVLFYIVMLPLFLIFIFGIKNIEITNLFPLFTEEGSDVLRTSYALLIFYAPLEFLLFSFPFIKNKEGGYRKGVIWAVAITAVFNLILFVLILGALGVHDAGTSLESFVAILQVAGLPFGFFKRQDALILMLWLCCIFSLISSYFYYLSRLTCNMIKQKSQKRSLLFYGILVFCLCFIHLTPEKTIAYYMKYMAYAGIPQSIVVPIAALLLGKAKEVLKKKSYQ